MACTRDGRHVYLGSTDGVIRMWDLIEGKEIAKFSDSLKCTWDIKLSADEKLLATCGPDQVVRVWDAKTAELISRCKGHQREVLEVEFSPGGGWLASAGYDGTVRLWDHRTGEQLRRYVHQLNPFVKPQKLVDATGREKWGRPEVPYLLWGIAISQDGKRIVGGGYGTGLSIWDADKGKVGEFKGHTPTPVMDNTGPNGKEKVSDAYLTLHGIRRLPKSDLMISVGADKSVRLWSGQTLQEAGRFVIPFAPWRFAVTEDGRRAIFGDHRGVLHVWAIPHTMR
jgi:hypothetical protein